MDKIYIPMIACALFSLNGTAMAQTDVTSKYLKNADFEGAYSMYVEYSKDVAKNHRAIYQPQDWDISYENGEQNDYSVLREGDLLYSSNFKGAFINLDEARFGKQTYRLRFRWGNKESLKIFQTVTLPKGAYELSADIIGNSKGKMAIYAGDAQSTDNVTDSQWKNVSVRFRSDGTTPIALGVAFTRSSDDQQNGVDNFKLVAIVDKEALNAAITQATTANTTLASDDLTAAIATAQAAADKADATQEEVDKATEELNAAVRTAATKDGANVTYRLANPSFENGDDGWTHDNGSDTKVKAFGADDDKTLCDGDHYFNAYDYNNTKNKERYVTQTVTNLAAGYYKVTVAASFPSAATVVLKVGDGDGQQLTAPADGGYAQYESALVPVAEGGSLAIRLSTQGDGNTAWFRADNFQLFYTSQEKGAQTEYTALVDEAKGLLNPTLGEGEEDAYKNVTGSERQTLQTLVDKEVTTDFAQATEALKAAIEAFKNAKDSYDGLAKAVETEAGELPYASEEKKTAFEASKNAGEPKDAADAVAKTTAIQSALRAYVESNAMAEGVEGAEDKTDNVANANFDKNIDNWTYSQTGGSLGWKNNEPYTLSDGTTGGYFDYYNGSANNQEVSQVVYDLDKGDYLLTVCERAQVGFTNFTLSVWTINEDEGLDKVIEKTQLAAIGNTGGVFGNGWNDTSLKFTLDEAQTIGIKVANGPVDNKNVAGWYSFSRVRLVKIGDGTPTGIQTPQAKKATADEPVYNLAGQRVGNDYRGLVIKNGKKMVIK